MADFEHLKRLCERRKQIGSVPWIAGNKSSMNAKVEIDRIDGLIVEEVMKLYEKADVRPVVRARWYWDNYRYDWCCSNCFHPANHHIDKDDVYKMPSFPFCPHCGADMQETNLDTTKGGNHD